MKVTIDRHHNLTAKLIDFIWGLLICAMSSWLIVIIGVWIWYCCRERRIISSYFIVFVFFTIYSVKYKKKECLFIYLYRIDLANSVFFLFFIY